MKETRTRDEWIDNLIREYCKNHSRRRKRKILQTIKWEGALDRLNKYIEDLQEEEVY